MSAADATQNTGGAKAGGKAKTAARKGKAKGPSIADFAKLMAGMATKIDIKEVTGQHDVYFVFKNNKSKPAQPLMSVSNIEFKDRREVPPPGAKL